jgi:hypothetical protein
MKAPFLFGLTLSAGLLATSAIGAEAISGSNVRSGPGTNYPVVDQLSSGEAVTVEQCVQSGWCLINHSGPDGWVSAKLLADNGNPNDYFNSGDSRVAVADEDEFVEDEFEDDGDLILFNDEPVRLGFGFGFGDFIFGRPGGRGDLVCLVTFFSRADVTAGRDADVQRAEILPLRVAERRDGPNDRRAIFEYDSDRETIRTCRYLDRLN